MARTSRNNGRRAELLHIGLVVFAMLIIAAMVALL